MGLYSGGLIIGKIFASEIWGAYFWEGLFLEGLLSKFCGIYRAYVDIIWISQFHFYVPFGSSLWHVRF